MWKETICIFLVLFLMICCVRWYSSTYAWNQYYDFLLSSREPYTIEISKQIPGQIKVTEVNTNIEKYCTIHLSDLDVFYDAYNISKDQAVLSLYYMTLNDETQYMQGKNMLQMICQQSIIN